MTVSFEDAEGYAGRAAVVGPAGTEPVAVAVQLRGHFQPIDGLFHWYGRIEASGPLASAHRAGDRVVVRTPHGEAAGKLSDVDPWGRFRVSGTGRPPFPV